MRFTVPSEVTFMSIPHQLAIEIDNVKVNATEIQDSICITTNTGRAWNIPQVGIMKDVYKRQKQKTSKH